MISIKELSWDVPESTYREYPCLSQSNLGTYQREGFESLGRLFEKKESSSLLFGSLVDTLVTSPNEFNNLYAVTKLPKIDPSLEEIVRELFKVYYPTYKKIEEIPPSFIHACCDQFNYYTNPKFHNARLKKTLEQGPALYNALAKVEGKTLIDEDLYQEALECKQAIMKSYAGNYFIENPLDTHIEHFSQLKFKATYEGIEVKGMLDHIIVDHKSKLIIPVDLKTSYKPAYKFFESYITWCYFLQSTLYTYLLEQNVLTHNDYKGYSITPFIFVVVSKSDKIPIVWKDTLNKSEIPLINSDGEILCDSWRNLLVKVTNYLKEDSKIPSEISKDSPNSLQDFIYGKKL